MTDEEKERQENLEAMRVASERRRALESILSSLPLPQFTGQGIVKRAGKLIINGETDVVHDS